MLQNLSFLKRGWERFKWKPTNFSLDGDKVLDLPSPLQLEFWAPKKTLLSDLHVLTVPQTPPVPVKGKHKITQPNQ